MGCGSSSQPTVVESSSPQQQYEYHGSGPPVPHQHAAAFIEALREEYCRGVGQAVGRYFDDGRQPLENTLGFFEERVQEARNKEAEIRRIEIEWGMAPGQKPAGGAQPPPQQQQQQQVPMGQVIIPMGTVVIPMGQVVGGIQAQPPPGVSAQAAQGFIAALEAEYLGGVDQAVGKYLDTLENNVHMTLYPYEERFREAVNKVAALQQLRADWRLVPPSLQGVATSQYKPQDGIIEAGPSFAKDLLVSPEQSAQELCQMLGLPPGTPQQQLAQQGLASPDPEAKRRGLNIAYHSGMQNRPEVVNAENELRTMEQLPPDWKLQSYAKGRKLDGGLGGRQDSTVIAFETQPQYVIDEIQGMFDQTYRKVYTRDRRGAPIPDRFLIKEVQRVMNCQVWREYAKVRQDLQTKLQGQTNAVPEGCHTMNYLKQIQTINPNRPPALPQLNPAVNECWLFHGTTREAAQGIAENDFRLDLTGSNAGTLYGKGIYLAENATKSDEYGEGPRGPASKEGEDPERGFEAPRPPPGPPPELVRESYILLCRSSLGKIKYTDEQRPNADNLQKSCLKGDYDSVLGDRLKINGTFREIIVYNDDHVYPEYIVRYERIFFHERFKEIYQGMLDRKRRGQFNGPSPQELEILTSMWQVFGMPNKGKINKWQLLDLLNAIGQPPRNEGEDLDATFKEWDTKGDGWIDCEEFLKEIETRVRDDL
mmetsp:Transcript_13814/g.30447  ORF Transcript_13814/g.30447 Transcript_13814/m.30447 type:complete len:706 (+) Transcript_13814:86-2203(+)